MALACTAKLASVNTEILKKSCQNESKWGVVRLKIIHRMKIIHAGDELVIRNTINLQHEDKHGIPVIIIHVRIIQS